MLVAGCAFVSFRNMIADKPALSFDQDNVRINTPFEFREYAWQDITGIYIQKVGVSFVMMMMASAAACPSASDQPNVADIWADLAPVAAIDLPPGGRE